MLPPGHVSWSDDARRTHANQSGAVTFPAPGATNAAQRFYRVVWQ